MGSLDVRLLGSFEVRVDGLLLATPESARAQALLTYLALHPGVAVPRERLAGLLWPESTESQARTNLRHLLHTLRRAWPMVAAHLDVMPTSLRWRGDPASWVDVTAFEALLARTGAARTKELKDAVDLYRGDLVEGLDDPWLVEERARLRSRLAAALTELAERAASEGEHAAAAAYGERLLRVDPLHEPTYRLLMRLHAERGDRALALRTYHRCAAVLERELGVLPAVATRTAYDALLPTASARPVEPRLSRRPPLVGRERERARLGAAWREAGEGHASLVLLTGEPGIGKTRLTEEFRVWCARRGAVTAAATCYAAEGPLPYGLITSWLRADAVRPRLPGLDRDRLSDLARLLPELRTEVPDLPRAEPLLADEQRAQVFDAVSAAFAATTPSTAVPLVLTVDDLQHADGASCRLLHYLLRERTGLLVVASARSERLPAGPVAELLLALRRRAQLVVVPVAGLDEQASAAVAASVTGTSWSLTDAAVLREQTGGNPLLVLEAARAGWRPDDGGQAALTPRVQAVLEARLAEVGPDARRLATAGAVIGRPFDVDLLTAAAEDADGVEHVVAGLDELWRHGIVREQGEGTAGRYDFAHQTLRAAAGAGLSPVQKARLHARVADALARRLAGGPGEAEVAAHWAAAGEPARAVHAYRRAAEAAQLLHAHAEAVRLLERALELLRSTPPSTARDADELALTSALLAPLVSELGYASPALSELHQRARALTRALERPPSPPLLRSLAMAALSRDEFGEAEVHARALHDAGRADRDDVVAVEAEVLLGFAAFWRARFSAAEEHLRRAVEHYRPERARTHLAAYGQDPRVVALARLGNVRWFLGRPEEAHEARAAAYAWAREVGHPYTRAAALLFGSLLALDMDEEAALRDGVAALGATGVDARPVRLCRTALQGLVAVLDGRVESGLALLDSAGGEAKAGAGAPGVVAIVARARLAASVAVGEPAAVVAAADALLDAGPGAAVWGREAHRVRDAFLARA